MIRTLEGGVASLPTTIEMADADLALMYLRHLYRSMTGEQALPAPMP